MSGKTIQEESAQSPDTAHWPTEIRYLSAEKTLVVGFDSGETFTFPAEFLRVESPSAEVQGHGPGQKQIVARRRHVGIMEIVPVGNYAVRIRFDDLHDSGIYSWQYLYRLGREQDALWQAYLDNLAAKGLSRDP
ncbi:MAG: gamma-butyrobetaine hydroxylase-like domain-containing protein [Kiloniellaceae bacterium]